MRSPMCLAVLVVLLLLAGCSQATAPEVRQSAPAAAPPQPRQEAANTSSATSEFGSQAQLPSVQERLVVRQATLALVVTDGMASAEKITSLTNKVGGYVVSQHSEQRGDYVLRTLTLRVPADRFDEVLKELRAMSVRVDRDDVQAQDVTEEYVDLDAQIRNLEASEEQYLSLMKRATQVDDVLKIQAQLSQVQGDIERLKARKQYLERSAQMSVITVTLTPMGLQQQAGQPGWSALRTIQEALAGSLQLGQVIVDVLIWLLILGIPLAAVIVPFWLLVRWLWRRRRPAAPASTS